MNYYLLLLTILFYTNHSFAQDSDKWEWFTDEKTELIGYKDANQTIRIPAKFFGFTNARKFGNIMAVMESVNEDSSSSYYLLKNGRKVGIDSIYVWDMTLDCEQENKIRFRDEITDKVGFFDGNGRVVIPAVYDEAAPFYNGLALVLKGAKRMCWEGGEYKKDNPCEHWSWKGGITQLINEKNEVLIDSFRLKDRQFIDWYTLKMTTDTSQTDKRIYFKGTNGYYYSFIHTQKEFESWFYTRFLPDLKSDPAQALRNYCFEEVSVEADFTKDHRTFYNQKEFSKRYQSTFLKKMKRVEMHPKEVALFVSDLNSFIFESSRFNEFYTDCGEHNKEEYPAFEVILTYYKKEKRDYQEYFEFLRTQSGYKLVLMAIENRH